MPRAARIHCPEFSSDLALLYSIKSRFYISAAKMAETYIWLATSKAAGERTGLYWDAPDVVTPPSRWAADPDHRRAIMELTERTVAHFA